MVQRIPSPYSILLQLIVAFFSFHACLDLISVNLSKEGGLILAAAKTSYSGAPTEENNGAVLETDGADNEMEGEGHHGTDPLPQSSDPPVEEHYEQDPAWKPANVFDDLIAISDGAKVVDFSGHYKQLMASTTEKIFRDVRERPQDPLDHVTEMLSAFGLGMNDNMDKRKRLQEAHSVLAYLYLFGLPDDRGRMELPYGWPRDIEKAMNHLRLGRKVGSGMCLALAGFLTAIGFPPQIDEIDSRYTQLSGHQGLFTPSFTTGPDTFPSTESHFLTQDGISLVFHSPGKLLTSTESSYLKEQFSRYPLQQRSKAHLNNHVLSFGDINGDAPAAAYRLASLKGDPIGSLALGYYHRSGIISPTVVKESPTKKVAPSWPPQSYRINPSASVSPLPRTIWSETVVSALVARMNGRASAESRFVSGKRYFVERFASNQASRGVASAKEYNPFCAIQRMPLDFVNLSTQPHLGRGGAARCNAAMQVLAAVGSESARWMMNSRSTYTALFGPPVFRDLPDDTELESHSMMHGDKDDLTYKVDAAVSPGSSEVGPPRVSDSSGEHFSTSPAPDDQQTHSVARGEVDGTTTRTRMPQGLESGRSIATGKHQDGRNSTKTDPPQRESDPWWSRFWNRFRDQASGRRHGGRTNRPARDRPQAHENPEVLTSAYVSFVEQLAAEGNADGLAALGKLPSTSTYSQKGIVEFFAFHPPCFSSCPRLYR
eukprot:GHVN01089292.1.p1 GENE.GHVN01089292.1~~GHVN01089292.1.p1  ORF type:complete len:729 (-),score=73.12 GHVN01089292.1:2178-4319(-)